MYPLQLFELIPKWSLMALRMPSASVTSILSILCGAAFSASISVSVTLPNEICLRTGSTLLLLSDCLDEVEGVGFLTLGGGVTYAAGSLVERLFPPAASFSPFIFLCIFFSIFGSGLFPLGLDLLLCQRLAPPWT